MTRRERISLTVDPDVRAMLDRVDVASRHVERLVRDARLLDIECLNVMRSWMSADDAAECVAAMRSAAVASPLLWDDEAMRAELPERFRHVPARVVRAIAWTARVGK